MWFFVLIIVLCSLLYLNIVKYNYWKNKKIPYTKPYYFFGNFASNLFRIKSYANVIQESYEEFPNHRYSGMFQFRLPVLLIRDPELIKQITIKDFEVFPEHTRLYSLNAEPLFGKNLFNMQHNEGWQDMRATLSPAFTSSKMKMLFDLMNQCSVRFINYYQQPNRHSSVELKDAFTRFASDVIGTSAFGVTCDSLKDRNNEFYLMGKDLTNFSGFRGLRFFSYTISPLISQLLKIRVLSVKVDKFFRSLISETLRIRLEKNIVREDMIHLLMEAQKHRNQDCNKEKHKKMSISDEDITAQALIFFLAGFEVTSSGMTHLAYQLAINSEIQQRLYDEISTTLEENSGRITFDMIMSMKYLDCVISESLRLNSTIAFVDRQSIRPYTIEPRDSSEKPLHLEKGTTIWIPISSLHLDAKYFPNPKKFDPERFNTENRYKIKQFTYLPFGSGPRICIGMRFALLEIKLIILQIVRHFEIVPNDKTQIPLKPDVTNFNNLPKEGVWVSFRPRVLK